MLKRFKGLFSNDLSIDLGTANTLVYVREKGIILNEPSVVAIKTQSGQRTVVAVGSEAKKMLGRTPGNISAIRPLKDGVIADFQVTEEMLKHFIEEVHEDSFIRPSPRILVAVPCQSTQVERRAIRESVLKAGAREVRLIEEPMAAAIGAGLPVEEASGSMVIDIGGGTTEIAVLSLGGIVKDKSIKVAGDIFTSDIEYFMRKSHNLVIGERSAEKIKIEGGSALENLEETDKEIPPNWEVQGRDQTTGKPKAVEVSYKEIAKFSTWLYTIAGNLAKTELRKYKRRIQGSIPISWFW